MRALLLAGAMLGLSVLPAHAGTPVRVEKVCPIDGGKFTFTETASYSTYGMYTDGMPQGSWTFPMPIAQCPDSRFPVIEEEYTDEQKAQYQALVLTPDYQAVKNEASYYLLDFVMARTGEQTPESHVWMLVQASWQVGDDAATYARYASELRQALEAAAEAIKADNAENWIFYQLSVANVLRQAGDFDAALAVLQDVEAPADNPRAEEWIEMSRTLVEARDTTKSLVFGQSHP